MFQYGKLDDDNNDYHDDGDVDDDDGEGNSHGLQTPENSIKLVLNFGDGDVVDDDDKSDPLNQMNRQHSVLNW